MGKYKIKNSNIKTVSKKVVATTKMVDEVHTSSIWDVIDCSKSPTYVSALTSQLKLDKNDPKIIQIEKYKAPINILHSVCRVRLNYTLANLPKLKDWDHHRLNFSFGKTKNEQKTIYDAMLSTPKVIVRAYAHSYEEDNNKYIVVHFYALAAQKTAEGLPIIYRLDILTSPDKPYFYGVKCLASIGGYVDGDCPLVQIATAQTGMARQFNYKSDYTSYNVNYDDDTPKLMYDVKTVDNINNIYDVCDYAFKLFNVTHSIASPLMTNNVYEIINLLRQKPKYQKHIKGGEFIKEFLDRGVLPNDGCERQYIYSNEGVIKTSNIHGKRINPSYSKPNTL